MAWIEIGSASDELFRTRGDVCLTYYSIRITPLSITLFSLKTSNQPWIFKYLNSNYFIPNECMPFNGQAMDDGQQCRTLNKLKVIHM